ncbi:MAG: response regulator [Anaerolineae bacterium]|nr:response regulator [Anaerolineae bacterium]
MSKILYVEDNLANRLLVKRVLEAAGHTVLEAVDGLEGIRVAQESTPDLILMDINIPGMDGYEVTTRLKSIPELKDIPIVALTAKVMAGDREMALTAGCDGYIPKPIDVDLLPTQVDEFLGGKREEVPAAQERVYLRQYSQQLVDRLESKIAELTQANAELQRMDELKSRFISIAAHELRTPLTVMQGYLTIILDPSTGFHLDDNLIEMLRGMEKGIDRLNRIVNEMLDVTKIEGGTLDLHLGPLAIKDVLSRAIQQQRPFAQQRGQQIIADDFGGYPLVYGDPERLLQVFCNLINNGIKYTPDGGTIRIYGHVIHADGDLRTTKPVVSQGDVLEVIVEDTGIGIDPDDQERIFLRFYEVKDPSLHSTSQSRYLGGGIGLGLAIARGIMEAHGGWVWAESEGCDHVRCPGSKFHVLIPLATSVADQNQAINREHDQMTQDVSEKSR